MCPRRLGGNAWRRRQFAPLLVDVAHVAPCYEYRDRRPDETQDAYTARLLDELEQTVQQLGPQNVIGFVAETVVGATAGAVPPMPGYLKGVRELCDRHGMLYIADEVMCGMGRTGHLFAFEEDGVLPDIVTIAKGLGGGYQPIGAVLCREKIIEPNLNGSGLFQHGHTYIGHATACAAALAVQTVIERDGLLAQVRERGDQLRQALADRLKDHPNVGDIRGRGLFLGVEFVSDRATKEPFDPARKVHARMKSTAMDNGLMIYPMGGTIDGVHGDHALIAPPFIVTKDDVEQIADLFSQTVRQVFETTRGHG